MSIGKNSIGQESIAYPGEALSPAVSPEGVAAPNRTFLVECQPYDTGGASTVKIGFSTGSKTPHYDGYSWHPNLKRVFESTLALFSSDMSPTSRGAPDMSTVEIAVGDNFTFLDSTGTSYDIRNLEWAGRRIRILFGNDTDTFENFSVLFDGKAEDVAWTEEVFSIELYDKSKDLEVPVQTNAFLGDETLGEGGASLKGDLKPLCYGIQRNIQPVQVDSATRIYTWHDGSSAEVIGIFDRGIELTNAGDISDLGLPSISNWTPRGGYFVTDLANSLIRLGAEPDGTVTLDVRGDNTGGYVDKIGDIIKRILINQVGVDSGDINQADINSFNALRSGPAGVYLRSGVNVSTLLQQWLTGVNGYWYFDRLGIFHLKVLGFTGSKETIEDKDIISIQRSQTTPPITKSRVGYRVLGTEQDLGNLDLPSTTISDPYNFLDNKANSTQTGEVTYLNQVNFASFDGGKPSQLSAGVWILDPTADVVNMRVELLFYNSSGGQVGSTQQGNFITGAETLTRTVVEGVDVPDSATSVTMRTLADSGASDVQNSFAMLNAGNVALPFVPGGVQTGVFNFNNRNDRDSTAIVTPVVAGDGTAIDHTVNTDGSVDISFEWSWAGNDEDIDGWYVYIRSDAGSGSYNFGDTPGDETRRILSPGERYFFLKGVPGDLYYTFGVQAFRVVDADVDNNGIILSSLVQPALGSEDPYQPEANIAFNGDITGTIDGVAAGTVGTAVTNFNNRNDRDGTAITTPTIASDGTAIDHVVNTDGSVDMSFEWVWTGNNEDIDGWEIYVRSSTSSSSYIMGTSADEEQIYVTTAEKRAFFYLGAAADKYYTFGVRAYRVVDPDVDSNEVIFSTLVQPSLGAEDPYQPNANPAFAGNLTGTVNGVAAATVSGAATNFNNRNDRNGSAITTPTISGSGTAIDHTSSTDGSANISFEWSWGGTESDIDGFIIYTRQSTSSSSYNFGTSPAQENIRFLPADRRAFFLLGVPADEYYTFGVQAYRVVDPDVDSSGLITSTLVQPALGSEDPYQPASSVSFNGNVTGTVNGTTASVVADGAANARPTMALALNTQLNGSTNNGEATIFAVDETGAIDQSNDGYFYDPDQNKITILRNEVGSGGTAVTWVTGTASKRGYFAYDSAAPFTAIASASDKTAFVFKQADGNWYYDQNNTTPVSFTPSTTTLALGWCETSTSDGPLKGGIFANAVRLEAVGETDVDTPYITPFAAAQIYSNEGSDATLTSSFVTRATTTVTGESGDELLIIATGTITKSSYGGTQVRIDTQITVDGTPISGLSNESMSVDANTGRIAIPFVLQNVRTLSGSSDVFDLDIKSVGAEGSMRVQDPVITVFKRLR